MGMSGHTKGREVLLPLLQTSAPQSIVRTKQVECQAEKRTTRLQKTCVSQRAATKALVVAAAQFLRCGCELACGSGAGPQPSGHPMRPHSCQPGRPWRPSKGRHSITRPSVVPIASEAACGQAATADTSPCTVGICSWDCREGANITKHRRKARARMTACVIAPKWRRQATVAVKLNRQPSPDGAPIPLPAKIRLHSRATPSGRMQLRVCREPPIYISH